MANDRKRAGSKRVTPKGTVPGQRRAASARDAERRHAESGSGRYTPPVPKEQKISPPWVPVLMFGLLGLGALIIILNYLGVLPTASGEASNWYLLLGLGLITGGFITATQYH
jgi:hypothetical protein